jgi:hypothetical protein
VKENGSAFIFCLTAFFTPFFFLMRTFRGVSVSGAGGGLSCQYSHN